jgi:hypothetical protein
LDTLLYGLLSCPLDGEVVLEFRITDEFPQFFALGRLVCTSLRGSVPVASFPNVGRKFIGSPVKALEAIDIQMVFD